MNQLTSDIVEKTCVVYILLLQKQKRNKKSHAVMNYTTWSLVEKIFLKQLCKAQSNDLACLFRFSILLLLCVRYRFFHQKGSCRHRGFENLHDHHTHGHHTQYMIQKRSKVFSAISLSVLTDLGNFHTRKDCVVSICRVLN